MKNSINKKLSALLIFAFLFVAKANAQIVYTDIPDTVITCSSSTCSLIYNLDLNNDGISDFSLSNSSSSAGFCCNGCPPKIKRIAKVSSINNNAFYGSYASAPAYLLSGDLISNNYSWQTMSDTMRYYYSGCLGGLSSSSGNWNSVNDHYLPVKFISSGTSYFGWIRMNIQEVPYGVYHKILFTIKSYAINSIPNQTILAGETSCAIPTVTLTASSSLSFCTGDSVTFAANGTGYQYQWRKGGLNISGATKQTYVAKIAGIYRCNVTNSCGSKLSGTKTVTVNCRLENEIITDITEHLTIYPNPAINSVTIKIPTDEEGEISVSTLYGQIIYSEKASTEQTQIDVSKFSAGVYFVRWSSGENSETKMFSVIK